MTEDTDRNVDAAINRVLLAERDAQAAIDGCREQARAILDAARLKVARIKAGADRRITRVQALSDQSISRTVAGILAETNVGRSEAELSGQRLGQLHDAIDALVKEMV